MKAFDQRLSCHAHRAGVFVAAILLALACLRQEMRSQSIRTVTSDGVTRTSATKSRAEEEAEAAVSLSADRIIALLNQEPGLLLQIKRLLARKAYDQGRILEPAELTDEALFRLLREDDSVRVLATREIENRNYIRAKPTQEELNRQREAAANVSPRSRGDLPSARSGDAHQPGTQEDAYWSAHDPWPSAPLRPEQPWEWQYPPSPWLLPQSPKQQVPARQPQLAELPENQDNPETLGDLAAQQQLETARVTAEQLAGAVSRRAVALRGPNSEASLASSQPSRDIARNLNFTATQPLESANMSRPGSAAEQQSLPELDHPIIGRRPIPYSNIPSLEDFYSQVSQWPAVIERFGARIFRTGTGNLERLPMDLPAGPEYVLGPGDGLNIELWGAVSQRLQRVVDREGRVPLPEVGAVQVAGRSLGDVQQLLQSALRTQFHSIAADVSLARIRSVRVYVVGDVAAPGAYDISALSTPLNALFAAGGPTSRGSMRHLRQYRGRQLVQDVDAYDLLLHGVHSSIANMQPGDTILVPPVGPEVTVEGMVRRPAIYELNGEKSLAEVLDLAGGVLASGMLRHVDVERVLAHENRTMIRVELGESASTDSGKSMREFLLQDGDKILIAPILPYANQTVYLDGHVFHPGKYPYREGMKVTDLIRSYDDLLPEPSQQHAEIIRLQPPDYSPVVLAFDLSSAMGGSNQNLFLKPFDTVRIFSRFGFEDTPLVTVTGEVRDPGDHITNGVTHLRDAVLLAGGITSNADLADAQVFRRTEGGTVTVFNVNLKKAIAGDESENLLLQAKDRVIVHRNRGKFDPPSVTIHGEVARPGKYPLAENMSAVELVKIAGGLKRGAYADVADLTRYGHTPDGKVEDEHFNVQLASALAGQPDTDLRLRDGDVLTIKQIAGWKDVGATIALRGEVMHPGTYGIREGERLSSVLARAGGFRTDAYPYGTIFEREQVRELEQENRDQLIRQVQSDGTGLNLIAETDADQKAAKEAAVSQWQTALQKLKQTPPSGRLVIHISSQVKRWANGPSDVVVRAGDLIYVPKKPNFVMVEGSVYNATAVLYKSGKNVGWYLQQAGGPTNTANKKAIFVIHADGSVSGAAAGFFSGGVERAALQPGDLIMVPERAFSGTTKWKATLESAQLAYAVGIAIQVARSF